MMDRPLRKLTKCMLVDEFSWLACLGLASMSEASLIHHTLMPACFFFSRDMARLAICVSCTGQIWCYLHDVYSSAQIMGSRQNTEEPWITSKSFLSCIVM